MDESKQHRRTASSASSNKQQGDHHRSPSTVSIQQQQAQQTQHNRIASTADRTIFSALSQSTGTSKIFTLKDVKSQFESEAEAAILKSIEDNERKARLEETDEDGVRRPSFLADIPADKVHLFSDVFKEDGDREEKSQTSGTGNKFKATSNRLMMLRRLTSSMHSSSNMIREGDQVFHADDIESQHLPTTFSNNNDEGNKEEDFTTNAVNTKQHQHYAHNRCYRYCGPCKTFINFLSMRKQAAWTYVKLVTLIIVGLVGIAAILFYYFDNPLLDQGGPSYSWVLLLLSKLAVTFTLGVLTEALLIDYLFLETKLAVISIGRFLTLMTVQAKGWPLRIFFWAIWNFALIIGDVEWKRHWLNFQDTVKLFTSENPGPLPDRLKDLDKLMIACIILGLSTMVKRACFALYLGKKKYEMFSPKLQKIIQKILLITEVAVLADEVHNDLSLHKKKYRKDHKDRRKWLFSGVKSTANLDAGDDGDDDDDDNNSVYDRKYSYDDSNIESNSPKSNPKKVTTWNVPKLKLTSLTKSLTKKKKDIRVEHDVADRLGLESLLGAWEEPKIEAHNVWHQTSVGDILEFREAIDFLGSENPFSLAYGLADTRKTCMESGIDVYKRLCHFNPSASVLNFDTLAILARDEKGNVDKEKARALILLFRPDSEGNITLLNFLKSCDKVYRRLRLFRAAVVNSNQLDDALGVILNIIFFVLMISVIILGIYELDPTQIFIGIGSLSVSISFAIGNASSKWFEGLLLVLVRKPYDIGDRIAISDPKSDTDVDGSTTWFVESVALYTTVVRNAATNEVATYNNGYLAGTRIINAARSPKACVYVRLNFAIHVPYEKLKIFRTVVENYVKDRPQEWFQFLAFRATKVEADLGYVTYTMGLQHVESWQNIGPILNSKADVSSFCLEVSKQMEMRFIAPPKPILVSLAKKSSENEELETNQPVSNEDTTNIFQKFFGKKSETG